MPFFRKRPVVIEAVQFTGDNRKEIFDFAMSGTTPMASTIDAIVINTLEGAMTASAGDWIIKGVNGEFYPCKPDIFAKSYEQMHEEE